MKKATVTLDVWILTAEDVEEVTDGARVRGTLQSTAQDLAQQIPGVPTVQLGLATSSRGRSTAWAAVAGHKLYPGDGVAIHPALPGGMVKVPEILLADAVEEKPKAKKAAKRVTA